MFFQMLFNRKRQVGILRIDGVKEATATSKGGASNIDGLNDFYLGGVPKGFDPKRVEVQGSHSQEIVKVNSGWC